jgi:hypothetical protein
MPDNLDELRRIEDFPLGENEDVTAPDQWLTLVPDLALIGVAVVGWKDD